jgi:hypothetical protein
MGAFFFGLNILLGLVWQVTLQNRTEQSSGLLVFEISKM